MKKIALLSLLLSLFTVTSCSDSDSEPSDLAAEAAGTYSGYTVASATYFSDMIAADQSVKITPDNQGKVNISFISSTWGTMTINGATVSGSADNMRIAGSGKSLMAHAGNTAKEYDCNATGTIVNGVLAITFNCPAVMGGLTINFKQGDIPAELVVPGTYTGYTEASCAYFQGNMADNQEITITQNADKTYKVSYTSDTWGEFTIDNATATLSGSKFALEGSGKTLMGMNGDIKEYDCTIAGTIDASKEDPTFTFTVPAVMGGLTITFHIGTMPATE